VKEAHLKELFNAKGNSEKTQHAIDIWRFILICNGINIKDMAHLKNENISGDQLVFFRKKSEATKRTDALPVRVHLNKYAHGIIARWGSGSKAPDDYVFPILEHGLTEREEENRIANFTKTVNKYLKRIGKELNIPVTLTTYTARHSFATKLKNSEKVSIYFIMEALGHSNISTTMSYLAGFEEDTIRKHSEVLMEGLEED